MTGRALRTKTRGGQRGLGLIEALVSVVIVAFGIIVICRPLLASVSALNYLDTRSEANRLLNDRMWEFREKVARNGWAAASGWGESVLGGARVYQCRQTARQIASGPGLYQVDFRIEWTAGGQRKSIVRSVYVLEPLRPQT